MLRLESKLEFGFQGFVFKSDERPGASVQDLSTTLLRMTLPVRHGPDNLAVSGLLLHL